MRPLQVGVRAAWRIVHWTARITGTLYAALIVLFVVAYLVNPTGDGGMPSDYLGLSLYPLGVCLGLFAALRWPLAGGLVTLGCLIGFWVWLGIARGDRDLPGPILVAFLPAVLYSVHGVRARHSQSSLPEAP